MILDAQGKPYPAQPPKSKAASLPVQNAWQDQAIVGAEITPDAVQNALTSATIGDGCDLARLAHAVERRDSDIRGVLHTRKLAVANRPWSVLPASDEGADLDVAEAATQMLRRLPLEMILYHALDGLHIGWSGQWVSWDTSEKQSTITAVQRMPGAYWTYRNPATIGPKLRVPRLITMAAPTDGIEPHRASIFLHEPTTMSAHPTEGGMCWTVFLLYLLRSYGLRDFSTFMAKFGIPWVMVHHPGGTDEKVIEENIRKISQGAYGSVLSIPEGWTAELLRITQRNAQSFVDFLDWLVHRYEYLVLGQSAATEAISGQLGGDTLHEHVREDIRQFDGAQLSATVTQDLLTPWVRYEYGPETMIPRFWLHTDLPGPGTDFLEQLLQLSEAGLRIGTNWVHDWFRVPRAGEDEEVLQGGNNESIPRVTTD